VCVCVCVCVCAAIKMLSLRFLTVDGAVSIPEFVEFLTIPSAIRTAIRMSYEKLNENSSLFCGVEGDGGFEGVGTGKEMEVIPFDSQNFDRAWEDFIRAWPRCQAIIKANLRSEAARVNQGCLIPVASFTVSLP
jgi:hypothetical protein